MPATNDAVSGDPLVGFNFEVKIEGALTGYFTECSGLGSESEVIEHKVVGQGGKEVVAQDPRAPEVGRHHPQAGDHPQHGHVVLAQADRGRAGRRTPARTARS